MGTNWTEWPVVLVTKKTVPRVLCRLPLVERCYGERRISRIDDSLWLLDRQQWFSAMDLASGYWQVAMSPDASRKTVFVTHEGLFKFRVMPIGLCNAPATFERLMDRVLSGMWWAHCLVCLDDVISFGTDASEALLCLSEVLEHLSSFGLQLKAKKCTFMQTEVAFLGHVVGRAGLASDPKKLSAVRTWHALDSFKQVRQLVGFVGYYRRFIPDVAGLSETLVPLTASGPNLEADQFVLGIHMRSVVS